MPEFLNGIAPKALESVHRVGVPWLAIFLVVFVVYPLSAGPALKIYDRYPSSRHTIEALYWPLEFTADHVPVVDDFFQWYFKKIWGRK